MYILIVDNDASIRKALRMGPTRPSWIIDDAPANIICATDLIKRYQYNIIIADFDMKDTCILDIIRKETIRLPATRITLAQSLPKGGKMDLIIQKSTELGANRIVPFISSRSIPRLTGARAAGKAARWCKIAIEASRQCGRGDWSPSGGWSPASGRERERSK